MYSEKLEPLKKGFHYAVVFDDWTYLEQYAKENNWREGLLDELKKSVEGVELNEERRLNAERCARETGLQEHNQTILVHLLHKKRIDEINERRLKLTTPAIDFTSYDYRDYQHEDGDVVYCDPPYAGVKGYDERNFDNVFFWEWVHTRDYPVYVSEYNAPDDFTSIWQKGIAKKGAGGKSAHKKAIEHVFVHQRWRKN